MYVSTHILYNSIHGCFRRLNGLHVLTHLVSARTPAIPHGICLKDGGFHGKTMGKPWENYGKSGKIWKKSI